jgi:tetratricopeptide (TPR) repeat protein
MDDLFARYQAALRAGHQLAAEGKFRDALGQYEQAATLAERPMPLIGIGGMQLRLGRPKEALAAFERAVALEPDNLDALSGRAAALLAAGRRDEAAGIQQQMAALRDSPIASPGVPAEQQTPLTRAETLAIAGEQARDAGQREAAIDAWLAEAREEAAALKFDAALDAALRALALDTGATRVHLALTRLYF